MIGGGKTVVAAGPGANRLKDSALALPIEKIASRNAVAVSINFRPDHDQLVRIRVWHRRKKSGVDNAEDGGVCADSQDERQQSNGREAEILEIGRAHV